MMGAVMVVDEPFVEEVLELGTVQRELYVKRRASGDMGRPGWGRSSPRGGGLRRRPGYWTGRYGGEDGAGGGAGGGELWLAHGAVIEDGQDVQAGDVNLDLLPRPQRHSRHEAVPVAGDTRRPARVGWEGLQGSRN